MKRILLIIIPLLALAGIWYVSTQSDSKDKSSQTDALEEDAEGNPDQADGKAPANLQGDTDLTEAPGGETPGVRKRVAEITAEEPEEVQVLKEGERWLEGQITWPMGHQPEGSVVVYALAKSVDRTELDSALAGKRESSRQINTSMGPTPTMGGSFANVVLAKTNMRPDGTFRIGVPDWRPVHLQVLGKHLYRKRAFDVPSDLSNAKVTLEAELGAFVYGKMSLTLPEAEEIPSPNFDGLVKVHSELALDEAMVNPDSAERGNYFCEADETGAFELHGLPASAELVLRAEPENHSQTLHSVGETTMGASYEVDLQLDLGRTLRGKVVDGSGQGIVAATVRVYRDDGPGSIQQDNLSKGTSDDQGHFEIANLPNVDLLLHARHEGWLSMPATKTPLETDETEWVLTMDAGLSLSGIVLFEDGSPAADIEVEGHLDIAHLAPMENMSIMRYLYTSPAAVSDGQGRFELKGLSPLAYAFSASTEMEGVTLVAHAESVRAKQGELTLTLIPKPRVQGQVLMPDGEPLEAYTLLVRRMQKGQAYTTYVDEKIVRIADPEGRFEVEDLQQGSWQIQVQSERFLLSPFVEVELPRPADADELVLTTQAALWIDGHVVKPAGTPVQGARISPYSQSLTATPQLEKSGMDRDIRSLEDGSFSLGPVPAGQHNLRATHEDYCPSEPIEVDLSNGPPTRPIVLQLRQGATLTGEVFKKDGSLQVGGMIQATNNKFALDSKGTQTDAKGQFRLENLIPGKYQIIAMAPLSSMMEGMEQKEMNVAELMQGMQMAGATLVDGETVHVVIGSPPKEPVHVSGTVTLSGKPVEGGILSFFGEGRAVMENLAFASVDADGNYDLILEGGGPYLISVQRMGASALEQITIELTRTIPNEEEVRLDIALPEARISGKIQSPDGSPAAETRVSIYTEGATSTGTMLGGSYVEAVSDVDGVYDIRGLQAGSYFVCAGGPSMMGLQSDSEEQASGRVFSDTFTLKENQWVQNVNLKLKSPGTLRARMLDEEGKPVGGAALFMRDHRGRPLESFSLMTSDSNGYVEYTGLAPGSYTAMARLNPLASKPSAAFTIKSGETTNITLELEPGTLLQVVLRDKDNQPCKAKLQVLDPDGISVERLFSLADIQGLYSDNAFESSERMLGPFASGKYLVRALIGDEWVEKTVRLRGQGKRKVVMKASR